jgi:site-specific recombinase
LPARSFARRAAAWDLTALLNAADPKASRAERQLWLVRLLEWLRHAPLDKSGNAGTSGTGGDDPRSTPTPVLRLKHLLGVLDRNAEHRARVAELLHRLWREIDSAALLADFGFAPRMHLWGELVRRVRARVLPLTPDTGDLGELFALLFPSADDARWLRAIDAATLARLGDYFVAPVGSNGGSSDGNGGGTDIACASADEPRDWRLPFLDAIVFLGSAVRAAGFSPALRPRMSPELLAERPFRQLARAAEKVEEQAHGQRSDDAALLREAQYLRALLDRCRAAADSVHQHLEAHGVSVDVVFEVDQLRERTHRIELLLNCVISPQPARDVLNLAVELVQTAEERRSLRALLSRHYSLLARKVAERSAETGEHYITRDRGEYRQMLQAALGGGAVLAGTTLLKFLIVALALSPFWGGLGAGINYAASFVLVQLLHFTVATKQPAMTAPAMAARLTDVASDAAVEGFVDEVTHLIRSQAAGIFGNLFAVAPIVLGVQLACRAAFGAPLVGHHDAQHVLDSLTLLGPTALYAAFTGVLLFASSIIGGWAENWFVWHRLDSAIAWNPRIVARLGAARARRWADYWRTHVSGFASNISLGLMLGLVPAVAAFFALPVEVRHVTLSTGQIAAALGTEGIAVLRDSAFWWCVAAIPVTAALNLGVSFVLAFRVALRSRSIRLADRSRIYRAIRRRLWHAPLSFVLPPRSGIAQPVNHAEM